MDYLPKMYPATDTVTYNYYLLVNWFRLLRRHELPLTVFRLGIIRNVLIHLQTHPSNLASVQHIVAWLVLDLMLL